MKRTCVILLAAVVSAALIAGCVPALPGGGAAACPARKAILLAGYDTATDSILPNSVKHTFDDLVPALGSLHDPGGPAVYAGDPVYFSYRGPGTSYTMADTHDALSSNGGAIDALHATVTDILKACPATSLDLIGHSLGGVVAWEYIVQYGNTSEGSHIRHLITLDSPVNGLSKWPGVLGALSPTAEFLLYTHELNPAATNIDIAVGLSPHMVIRTFTSEQDQFVLRADALIAKDPFQQPVSLPQACPSPDSVVGLLCLHGQILQDAGVRQAIMDTLLLSPSGTPPSPESASPQPTVPPVPLLSSSAPAASPPSAQPTIASSVTVPTLSGPAPSTSGSAPETPAGQPSAQLATERVYGQPDFTSNTANNGGLNAASLNVPLGVAVDPEGNLYVADKGNERVLFYPRGSTVATRIYGQPNFTSAISGHDRVDASSLYGPTGVAVDASGNLYVADTNNDRVLFYPKGLTTATRVYGQPSFTGRGCYNGGRSATSLCSPEGVAVDGNGNLYIAETNRVLFYPQGSTTATRIFGQPDFTSDTENNGGVSANSLDHPEGVAVDASGNVYIADAYNNRVLLYPQGATRATRVYGQPTFASKGGEYPSVSATSLDAPNSLAVDASGNLYVVSLNRVLFYAKGSTMATRVYGQPNFASNDLNNGGVGATSLAVPEGVAVDAGGNRYVADSGNNRVLLNMPLSGSPDETQSTTPPQPLVSSSASTAPASAGMARTPEEARQNAMENVLKDPHGKPWIMDKDNWAIYVLAEENGYTISYYKKTDYFQITINALPFEEQRKAAEQRLLEIINTPPEVACDLNVTEGIPFHVSHELSGRIYYLSFCTGELGTHDKAVAELIKKLPAQSPGMRLLNRSPSFILAHDSKTGQFMLTVSSTGAQAGLQDFDVFLRSNGVGDRWWLRNLEQHLAVNTLQASIYTGAVPFTPGNSAAGRQVFVQKGCGSCHEGTRALAGLDLAHYASFTRASPEALKQWMNNPQAARPDSRMPKLALTDQELNDVVTYLEQLK